MQGRLLNGRYELLAPIGAGGMGQVWRARDRSLDREVAVKLLVPSASADDGEREQLLARFRQEARAAASLDSPYIVAVHDHGEDDGTPYLVMALVQGRSLDQILRESVRVPVADALRWAADVCRALDVAHTAGIVHRDIKPGNVMVARDGTAKVVDFGIATFVEHAAGDSRLTRTGQLPFGSVPYLAPERFRQEAGDGRTDLYALGCVLYELLVGRPPFTGTAVGVMYHHVNDAPLRPGAARREVTRPVERLVLDLLAKAPEDRPADAATALDRILTAARSLPSGTEAEPEATASPVTDAAPSGPVPFDEVPPTVTDARPDPPPPLAPTPTVRVQAPAERPPAPRSLATAHTRPAPSRAGQPVPLGKTTTPVTPAPGRRSRKRLLLPAALILAVGIPAGFGVQALTAPDAGSTSGAPSVTGGKAAPLEIGVAHSYRHVGNSRGTDAHPDQYEKTELTAFKTQQLRTVKSALTETLGAKKGARFRVVPVTADPDTTSRELLARHPGMLAVVGDTTDFSWVHDTDEAFLPEISTCAEYAHAGGAFAIPADEARQGEAMARYLRSRTPVRRVLVAEDKLWADRADGIGTALRKGGIAVRALDVEPGKVESSRIPSLVTAARADAVVVPTGTRAGVWAKTLRADGFKGPVLTQADPDGTCADSEDRSKAEARDKNVPAGVLRTRNYSGEPGDNLPARGNQELYDGALALATALKKLPSTDTSATSLRHTLDREIQHVSVNGVLDDISFEKRRSARGRPVWFDRREGNSWTEIGEVDTEFEPTRR
ncbi:protein kinase [Streptomyces sp. NPDC017988]|uniref:bifunctional serine/threonine-protein kinase/ABC transporter substrate-binding protein n=1 Tax=Streptomyces sp. NPDC017988 TaxID=3365025 RepID=UPI0037AE421B